MSKLSGVKKYLQNLSFKKGVIVLCLCLPCYFISFAQVLLPISVEAKGVLWFIFFGLAKTFQYAGITILGVEGYERVRLWLRLKKDKIK